MHYYLLVIDQNKYGTVGHGIDGTSRVEDVHLSPEVGDYIKFVHTTSLPNTDFFSWYLLLDAAKLGSVLGGGEHLLHELYYNFLCPILSYYF